MKKLFSALLLIALGFSSAAFAKWTTVLAPSYMKYYRVDKENLKVEFVPLPEAKADYLMGAAKKEYKMVSKIEQLLSSGEPGSYAKAWKINNGYIPTILAYYNDISTQNIDKEMNKYMLVSWLEQLEKADTYDIFSKESISYYKCLTKEPLEAIYDLQPLVNKYLYERKFDDFSYRAMSTLAYFYLQTKDYLNAIKYARMVSPESQYINNALDTLFQAYFGLGKTNEAYNVANQLYSIEYPDAYTANLRMGYLSNNADVKLKYFRIAKQNTNNPEAIGLLNRFIGTIYTSKLEQAAKTISGYYKMPNVYNLVASGYEDKVENCLQYTKTDLQRCLEGLNNEY